MLFHYRLRVLLQPNLTCLSQYLRAIANITIVTAGMGYIYIVPCQREDHVYDDLRVRRSHQKHEHQQFPEQRRGSAAQRDRCVEDI